MDKLKHCPFCGSEPATSYDRWGNMRIECANLECGCSFMNGRLDNDELIDSWNGQYRTWNLLMEWLDEIYPAHIFDGSSGNIGPQILVKLREIDELRRMDS